MSKKKRQKVNNEKPMVANNGLCDALDLPCNGQFRNDALTSPISLYNNSNSYLLTLNWVPLTYAYKNNGFIQTAINQIVDDAFRNDGLIIDTKTLDVEELELLKQTIEDEGDIEAIKDTIRWGQLYGGGVLIANTDQDYSLPLDEKQLKDSRLTFMPSNRWQCIANGISPELAPNFTLSDNLSANELSGITIDTSRIGIFTGVKAPYLLHAMLQGWGLSIFESIIPPLNQYLKAMGVTLELLDEAKIDVVKIFELASTLKSPGGDEAIRKRLQLVTDNKNYKSSIAMDSKDDYVQKQINFSGLPEMITQIQYLVCAALKRPYSKIFGKGSSGFSSGEDDLENYNTIVDSEIRTPARKLIKWVVDLRCLQLFGRKLPDFSPKWRPLKVLSAREEQEIANMKIDNLMKLVDRGIASRQFAAQKLTEDDLILFSEDEISQIDNDFTPENYDKIEDLTI